MDSKKAYGTPMATKIEFDFKEQVVASGGSTNNCQMYADPNSTRNTDNNDGVCRIYDRSFYADM